MEPEGSLPYSQVLATCPYPEPAPSSPHNLLQLTTVCYPFKLESTVTSKKHQIYTNGILDTRLITKNVQKKIVYHWDKTKFLCKSNVVQL
jgi:hypothetical protein